MTSHNALFFDTEDMLTIAIENALASYDPDEVRDIIIDIIEELALDSYSE